MFSRSYSIIINMFTIFDILNNQQGYLPPHLKFQLFNINSQQINLTKIKLEII